MSQVSDEASATPQPASAPPLASFDPQGVASVISYQTPESTSYEGRHVLKLDYTLADFADVIATEGQAAAEQGGSARFLRPPPEPVRARPTGSWCRGRLS